MGRLKQLTPRVGSLGARITTARGGDERSRWRDESDPFRKLYHTQRWQTVRWRVLLEAQFTCADCKVMKPDTSELVADHIDEARLDPDRFFERSNLQCLCRDCHSRRKQAEERRRGFRV